MPTLSGFRICAYKSHSTDASYLPWSADLRLHLLNAFPFRNGLKPIPEDVLLEPKVTLQLASHTIKSNLSWESHVGMNVQSRDQVQEDTDNRPKLAISNVFVHRRESGIPLNVILQENRRMTPESHWQDVRKLILTTKDHVDYMPGDVLTLYPQNPEEDVKQLLECMDWTEVADQKIQYTESKLTSDLDIESPLPDVPSSQPTTLRELLTNYLDFNTIPRRSFFSTIVHFTNDPFQKDRLLEFTKPEYLDELYDYTTRPRRSILEVLQEFDTVKIPWQWAVSVLPELRGRQFSIASGGKLKGSDNDSTRFELLVAIVKYKTVIKKIRQGTCSRYVADLPPGTALNVTLQRGGLGLSKSRPMQPVIMIGPGTGVAPIRSLIWERLHETQKSATAFEDHSNAILDRPNSMGETVLFFGGRSRSADYYFEHEWQDLQGRMPLRVFTAFSRDQSKKIYVQDVIKEQSALVYRLLYELKGIVYICGSSGKMPQAVREALIEAFQMDGSMNRSSAEACLLSMEKDGRYKQETW